MARGPKQHPTEPVSSSALPYRRRAPTMVSRNCGISVHFLRFEEKQVCVSSRKLGYLRKIPPRDSQYDLRGSNIFLGKAPENQKNYYIFNGENPWLLQVLNTVQSNMVEDETR